MPTGYTHRVGNGEITLLRDYAMTCARAFGALIMMRDDPVDARIPERFEPDTKYYDNAIEEAEKTLVDVEGLSLEECGARAAAAYQAEMDSYNRREDEKAETKARYQSMVTQIHLWHAPAELGELKRFMLEQLFTSMDFDCGPRYGGEPKLLTPEDWRAQTLEQARRGLANGRKRREEEIARTEGRNKWLQSLRDSLPTAPALSMSLSDAVKAARGSEAPPPSKVGFA